MAQTFKGYCSLRMDKLALVIYRYGTGVSGGAEYECRALAEHLRERYELEVLTTCVKDLSQWKNEFPVGVENENGIIVRRFPVEHERDQEHLLSVIAELQKGHEEELPEYVRELGPYCPKLNEYLNTHSEEYRAVLFFTYLYAPTLMGLDRPFPHSILIPTAHDESTIHLLPYRKVFANATALLFNSLEEKEFVDREFGTSGKPYRITCVGIDTTEDTGFSTPEIKGLGGLEYVIYVGRISPYKGFYELNAYFVEYKRRNPGSLKLVVLGTLDEGADLMASKDIIYTGYVSEKEKRALISGAKVLIMPSFQESLSLVILEAMSVRTPVLVNGACSVLRGQCIRSNAGLYYRDFFEFEASLRYILEHQSVAAEMGNNGIRFVKRNYKWEKVVERVVSLIEEVTV